MLQLCVGRLLTRLLQPVSVLHRVLRLQHAGLNRISELGGCAMQLPVSPSDALLHARIAEMLRYQTRRVLWLLEDGHEGSETWSGVGALYRSAVSHVMALAPAGARDSSCSRQPSPIAPMCTVARQCIALSWVPQDGSRERQLKSTLRCVVSGSRLG